MTSVQNDEESELEQYTHTHREHEHEEVSNDPSNTTTHQVPDEG
jgi:predicted small metal-binding protein